MIVIRQVRVCVCVWNVWIDVKLLRLLGYTLLVMSSPMNLQVQGAQVWLWFLCQRRRPDVTVISRGDVPLTYLLFMESQTVWHGAKPRTPSWYFHWHFCNGEGLSREPYVVYIKLYCCRNLNLFLLGTLWRCSWSWSDLTLFFVWIWILLQCGRRFIIFHVTCHADVLRESGPNRPLYGLVFSKCDLHGVPDMVPWTLLRDPFSDRGWLCLAKTPGLKPLNLAAALRG